MYRITCDGNPLFDARYDDYTVLNPKIHLEANTIGSGSFTIYNNHPYFNSLQRLKSIFEVSDEFGVIFRGRMTDDTENFYKGLSVDLEGAMGYFNDSRVRPYYFPDDFLEDEDYIAAAESGNVVEFFLRFLIEQHNAQVSEFQRFKLGKVTVADPNNYIHRSDTSYPSTWETLKNKLFESSLGGYLCIRYEEDGNYIDYLSGFTVPNKQTIEIGLNLLDFRQETDATSTYSAIIPIGAEIEETAEDGTATKIMITLESVEDGNITEDIVKQGDTLYSISAVQKYGWIFAPIADTTWEDVTEVQNLLTKSTEYMENTAILTKNTIELTAADLHFTDSEVQSFRIYRLVNVRLQPDGKLTTAPLPKLNLDLLNPQNTKITVGETKRSLTDIEIQRNAATERQMQNLIEQMESRIQNSVDSIVAKTIVTWDDWDKYAWNETEKFTWDELEG